MNKKHSFMKRSTGIILAVMVLLVMAVSALAYSYHVKREKLTTTFAQVQVGDTKETVVKILGQPDEVENCSGSNSTEELTKRCVETYWYMSFLERWGFSFNKDGKVIDKTHNVSF